jgi:uncharacterized protein (TIGR03083 family)
VDLNLFDEPEHRSVVGELGGLAAATPPSALRGRVLAHATARRTAGMATALGALARTIDDVDELLASLTDADWGATAHPAYGDVHDLVAHLAGIEQYLIDQMTGSPVAADVIEPSHSASTAATVRAMREAAHDEVRVAWRDRAHRAVGLMAEHEPSHQLSFHGNRVDVDMLAVFRTFEIWTHGDDIARGTGRTRLALDAPRLALMSSRLVELMPAMLELSGVSEPGRSIELALTGPGGTTCVRALDGATTSSSPDARIKVSTIELCRVAARRADVRDLHISTTGDIALADRVLACIGALALD